jgi:hypothetical protein
LVSDFFLAIIQSSMTVTSGRLILEDFRPRCKC